jgi:hypothetical protein
MSININLIDAYGQFYTGGLLHHELTHIIFALPFAIYIYKKSHSLTSILVLFLVTIFVDVDHLADYFLHYGVSFDLTKFFKLDYFGFSGNKDWALVPFHGWEWLILLVFINMGKRWDSKRRAVLFGYLPHIVLDTINVSSIIFYSLTYRIILLLLL